MSLLQVNYDELSKISELFRDDGDDLAQFYSLLKKEMQALQHEWIGEAADAFYADMEEILLPALKRTYEASHLSSDVTRKIVKLIHNADQETGAYFGDDFGAGLFAEAGMGLGAGSPGSGDDFGASQFEEALPSQGADAGEGAPSIPTAPEVSKKDMELDEPPESEKYTAAAASGGGGGGSSSGAQGDLKGLGSALGAQPTQVNTVGGVEPEIPDHVFDSRAAAPAGGSEKAPAEAGVASAGSSDSGGGAAAGIAGVAGTAAAGAAAKALKDKSEQSG